MGGDTAIPVPAQAVDSGTPRIAPYSIGAAALLDLAAAAVLIVASLNGRAAAASIVVALGLHLGAVAVLASVRGLPRSQRWLLVAFGTTMPVVGIVAAAFPLWGGGRSPLAQVLAVEDEVPPPPPDVRLFEEVGDVLAPFEALLVSGVEERRAMLWALGRRADREAIALLRWSLRAAPGEMGLEAALALEDISNLFEKRLAGCRSDVEATPTRATALAVAEHITHGFEVGLLDIAQYDGLMTEARRYFALAQEQEPALASEVALKWARLELAVLRADLALEVLDRALPSAPPELAEEMGALRNEAALRSHDLPWEGPSLLATYRRTLPLRPAPGAERVARTGSAAVLIAPASVSASVSASASASVSASTSASTSTSASASASALTSPSPPLSSSSANGQSGSGGTV